MVASEVLGKYHWASADVQRRSGRFGLEGGKWSNLRGMRRLEWNRSWGKQGRETKKNGKEMHTARREIPGSRRTRYMLCSMCKIQPDSN